MKKKTFYEVIVKHHTNEMCRMTITVIAGSIVLAEKKALVIAKAQHEVEYRENPNKLYTDSVERMGEIYI